MGRDRITVYDNTKIQLHIYVLGYYPQGESILIIVWDDASMSVQQSTLIDFYEASGVNRMKSLLDKYGIDKNKLDFIIWTHPDKDHSVGLHSIINTYTSNKTVCILPDGLTKHYKSFFSTSVLKSYLLLCCKKHKFKSVERVNASKLRLCPIIYGASAFNDGQNDEIELNIEVLTPIANRIFQKIERDKSSKANDLSISVVFRFGELGFYFGGDSENPSIREIDTERLRNIVFIKIPHHGSETSDVLPKILSGLKSVDFTKKVVSVSTSYVCGKSKLPDFNVLYKYIPISSDILLTEDDKHVNNYGIWACKYNIRPFKLIQIFPEGDASRWLQVAQATS
jgi:hypothetical protein